MYGSIKPHKSAQLLRRNLKLFDSTELASGCMINSNSANESQRKIPTYFSIDNLLQCENIETSNDSILKSPNLGNLTIKNNGRHNIKFFDSTEICSNSPQNDQKLPGYFQVGDILNLAGKNSSQPTKLII